MPDQPFLLETLHIVPDPILVIFLIVVGLQRMQKIEVKISRAGPLETDPELSLALLFIGRHKKRVDLGRQRIAVSGIAVHQRFFGRFLRRAVLAVYEGCVKIRQARFHEQVDHFFGLLDVDHVRIAGHGRKPHKSKSQLGGV